MRPLSSWLRSRPGSPSVPPDRGESNSCRHPRCESRRRPNGTYRRLLCTGRRLSRTDRSGRCTSSSCCQSVSGITAQYARLQRPVPERAERWCRCEILWWATPMVRAPLDSADDFANAVAAAPRGRTAAPTFNASRRVMRSSFMIQPFLRVLYLWGNDLTPFSSAVPGSPAG